VNFLRELLKKEMTKEISAFVFIIIFVYALKNIINLFLLTFLFTYLIYSLEKVIIVNLRKYIKLKEIFITVILYSAIFVFLTYFVCKYVPIIINQSITIMNGLIGEKSQSNINKLEQYLYPLLGRIDIRSYVKNEVSTIFQLIANIGKWGMNIILALILSLFFMTERIAIRKFLYKFKTSRISVIYKYVAVFGREFLNSFGKIIQAQILVAGTNTMLSLIALSIMDFPQIIALTFMIFIFSLIPIVGSIISLIPLSIIAFNVGGVVKVMYVLSMGVLLYAVESYVLTPQFMSTKTQIPVFFIFIILIVSQYFIGVWGLLIGIPLFMFILRMIGINLNKK
jgi:predicted PurR-regulated permease PerM